MQHDPIRARDYAPSTAEEILVDAIRYWFAGRIALVSSFGAESVVLLHMISRIDPATPVLFSETGRLFAETLEYQKDVAARLGLTDIRLLRPDRALLAAEDPQGDLARVDGTRCCTIRKVQPLQTALEPFSAWITGRKRNQTATRASMDIIEADHAGRVKLNPLADWTVGDVQAYMARHDLPRHPLVEKGFASIGCAPCTEAVIPGENPRAGRWRDQERDECGIHFENGRAVRRPVKESGNARSH